MKHFLTIVLLAVLFSSCDSSRVYEKNVDFEHRFWPVAYKPEFEFQVSDTTVTYNLYCNVRNSLSYPFSRLFVTYYLQDSIGKVSKKELINTLLFDPKTGAPQGSSGLGDIYDQRVLLVKNHRFSYAGVHKIKFEQFMRTDSLQGMLAVGVRVEKATQN